MSTLVVVGLWILSTALYLWITGHAVVRLDRPGALPLALLAAVLSVLSGLLAFNVIFEQFDPIFFGYGLVFATLFWTAFALEYTGRGPALTRRRLLGLFVFGLAVSVTQWLIVDVFALGSPYWLVVSASTLTVISMGTFGIFLVIRSGVTYDDLPLTRALVIAGIGIALVTVWISAIVLEEILELEMILEGVVLVLLILTGLLGVGAQQRYQLLETEPSAGHLARDSVIDEMGEAVIVADREGQLLDSNRTAAQLFDITPTTMLGEPLETILGTRLDDHNGDVVSIETQDSQREYEIRQSPVREDGDRPVGTIYLLRDVTDQRTHEQQLAVLNRVLRHNLRNDFDSIRGFAEPVADGTVTAGEAAELGERIRDTATGIKALGEKVSRTEQLLEWDSLDREHVDLVTLTEAITGEMRAQYPDGRIETSTTAPSIPVRTNREILSAVIKELVDNGLKHGQRDTPTVSIELRRTTRNVTVAVRDDGSEIPEHERNVLLDGEETPLHHGSGIGLWFVYWGIRRLGGTISFATNHPQGSVVRLTLPTADRERGGPQTDM